MCDEFTEADLDRAGLPVRRRDFGALMGVGAVAAMPPGRSRDATSRSRPTTAPSTPISSRRARASIPAC